MKAIAARKPPLSVRRPVWRLCLYVADQTPRSLLALVNLRKFCREQLTEKYTIKVIDIIAQPQSALAENIVALPTLVRREPKPMRRVIGDLSDTARVRKGLEVKLQG
jgi:circadian clock protein KaiB